MIPAHLQKALGKELGGLFYLHGAEPFRRDEAVRALIEAHLAPDTRDFNLDQLRGGEVSQEQLATLLGTPPMMAEWRVVVLEETEQLAQSPKARDRVLDAARNPPEGVALILSCTPPSGSTAKFYGDLAKAARSMEFRSVPESDLPAWLMERGREAHGVEVEEAAARALAQAVGSELGILNHELKKLAGMVDPGGVITLKEVEAAGTRIPRQDRWAWFDLVAERRTDQALEGLRVLLTHGDSGVGLTLGLATHFLRLGLAASDPQALQRALPPRQAWLADKMRRQAKLWSREEIRTAIEGLYRVDRLLKASGLSDQHLMEGWLLEQEFSRTQAA